MLKIQSMVHEIELPIFNRHVTRGASTAADAERGRAQKGLVEV